MKGKGNILTYWAYPERTSFYELLPRPPSIRRSSLLGVGVYDVPNSARPSVVADDDDLNNKGKIGNNQKPKSNLF